MENTDGFMNYLKCKLQAIRNVLSDLNANNIPDHEKLDTIGIVYRKMLYNAMELEYKDLIKAFDYYKQLIKFQNAKNQ